MRHYVVTQQIGKHIVIRVSCTPYHVRSSVYLSMFVNNEPLCPCRCLCASSAFFVLRQIVIRYCWLPVRAPLGYHVSTLGWLMIPPTLHSTKGGKKLSETPEQTTEGKAGTRGCEERLWTGQMIRVRSVLFYIPRYLQFGGPTYLKHSPAWKTSNQSSRSPPSTILRNPLAH